MAADRKVLDYSNAGLSRNPDDPFASPSFSKSANGAFFFCALPLVGVLVCIVIAQVLARTRASYADDFAMAMVVLSGMFCLCLNLLSTLMATASARRAHAWWHYAVIVMCWLGSLGMLGPLLL